MVKHILRSALFPLLMILRLMLGLAAFMVSIASSVLGLTVSLFALLSECLPGEFFLVKMMCGDDLFPQ